MAGELLLGRAQITLELDLSQRNLYCFFCFGDYKLRAASSTETNSSVYCCDEKCITQP